MDNYQIFHIRGNIYYRYGQCSQNQHRMDGRPKLPNHPPAALYHRYDCFNQPSQNQDGTNKHME